MELEEKRELLERSIHEIISHNVFRDEFEYIQNLLNISTESFIRKSIDYDLIPNIKGNDIYDDIVVRFIIYSKQFLINSHHYEKQEIVFNFLKKIKPGRAIDFGFGSPGLFSRRLQDCSIKEMTLVDFQNAAFRFAEIVYDYNLKKGWEKSFHFVKRDLNEYKYFGEYDAYIFMDSVEHIKNPESFLSSLINDSADGSNFIFTLPINMPCSRNTEHTIEWANKEEALKWLQSFGLKIIECVPIYFNMSGDIWALGSYDFSSTYILAVRGKIEHYDSPKGSEFV